MEKLFCSNEVVQKQQFIYCIRNWTFLYIYLGQSIKGYSNISVIFYPQTPCRNFSTFGWPLPLWLCAIKLWIWYGTFQQKYDTPKHQESKSKGWLFATNIDARWKEIINNYLFKVYYISRKNSFFFKKSIYCPVWT